MFLFPLDNQLGLNLNTKDHFSTIYSSSSESYSIVIFLNYDFGIK